MARESVTREREWGGESEERESSQAEDHETRRAIFVTFSMHSINTAYAFVNVLVYFSNKACVFRIPVSYVPGTHSSHPPSGTCKCATSFAPRA